MTTQPAVTRTLVPEDRRLTVTAELFGAHFPTRIEPAVFSFAGRLSEDSQGGYWEFYALGNGGFYMAPAGTRRFHVVCENGFDQIGRCNKRPTVIASLPHRWQHSMVGITTLEFWESVTYGLLGAMCSCSLYCVIGYSSQAISASLNFDLTHDGGASSTVVSGSEDPLLHSFNVGAHLVYRVTAVDDGYWQVNNTFSFSAALSVLDGGGRTGNWSVDFLLDGNSVSSHSLNNIQSLLHIGALHTLTAGTLFDEIVMTYDLLDSTTTTNIIQSREFMVRSRYIGNSLVRGHG